MNIREKMNLNLDWSFLLGEEKQAWYQGFDDSHWRKVQVPHDWSVEAPFSKEHSSGTGYLPGGIGWYRKELKLPKNIKDKKVILTIEGAYNNAKVWFNSYYLGYRPYGYSTFSFDVSDFVKQDSNVLSVRVNRDSTSDSRWFTGSGIYRNVYLVLKNKLHFSENGIFYHTVDCNKDLATVKVENTVSNETGSISKIQVVNQLRDSEGEIVAETTSGAELDINQTLNISTDLRVKQPNLWSPDSPYLYKLVSSIIMDGKLIDEEETTVGIRSIRFDAETGFYLNDVNTVFKGICIHHDAGALGAAVPKEVWNRRLLKLKDVGANAIRMSHNPPSPDLLDLCDELGFLVINEAFDEWEGPKNKWSTGHNVYPPRHDGYYEHFPQWGERDLKDLVLRDRNHPSIISWSIGNEIDYPNDPYCHPLFKEMTGNNDRNKPKEEMMYDPNKPNAERLVTISKKLVKWVKEIDQTRPVTAALAFPELSNRTGLSDTLDVVGYNYKEHLYEEDHKAYPNRIMLGSENGHTLDNWLSVLNNSYISGQFLWTGIDFLGEAHGWPIRGSQAGLLDIAGFEKPLYYFRKSLWSDDLFCKISVQTEDSKTEHMHWDFKETENVKIRAYTNAKKVECFVNGKPLGVQTINEIGEALYWEVPFVKGEVRLVAYDEAGNSVEDRIETPNQDEYKLLALGDKTELISNGEDISHIEVSLTDNEGKKVIDDKEIEVVVDGPVTLLGIENGDLSDLTPYSENKRKLYNGKALLYIRSKQEEGEATVRINSKEIKSTDLKFVVKNT